MNIARVVSTIRKNYEFFIQFIFQYCGPYIIRLMLDAEAWFKDAMEGGVNAIIIHAITERDEHFVQLMCQI